MADLPTAISDAPTGVPDPTQQCGRCRRVFDMEPTHEAGTLAEMWLCASCRVALLGRPTPVAKRPA